MKIGDLEEVQNNGEKEYWGSVRTLNHNFKIRLIANRDFGGSPGAPDYLIMSKNIAGSEIQIGSAWLKPLNNPTSHAKEFFSITIDDLSLPQPLNVAAFPKGDKKWDITWRRRQTTPQEAA